LRHRAKQKVRLSARSGSVESDSILSNQLSQNSLMPVSEIDRKSFTQQQLQNPEQFVARLQKRVKVLEKLQIKQQAKIRISE
jgi:hypothetical protein